MGKVPISKFGGILIGGFVVGVAAAAAAVTPLLSLVALPILVAKNEWVNKPQYNEFYAMTLTDGMRFSYGRIESQNYHESLNGFTTKFDLEWLENEQSRLRKAKDVDACNQQIKSWAKLLIPFIGVIWVLIECFYTSESEHYFNIKQSHRGVAIKTLNKRIWKLKSLLPSQDVRL